MKKILVAIVILFLVVKAATWATGAKNPEAWATRIAETESKKLPIDFGGGLQITKISKTGPRMVTYSVVLPHHSQVIDRNSLARQIANGRSAMLQNADVRRVLKWGVTVQYNYLSRDNVLLSSIKLSPSDIGQK